MRFFTIVGRVIGAWALIHGSVGLVMSQVTVFLFAFSGGQARMGPVVAAGF